MLQCRALKFTLFNTLKLTFSLNGTEDSVYKIFVLWEKNHLFIKKNVSTEIYHSEFILIKILFYTSEIHEIEALSNCQL